MTVDKTLLIDSVDLQGLPGVVITDPNCLRAPGIRRAPPDVIPGRRGQMGTDGVLDAYPFTVPVNVNGTDAGDLEANLDALGLALGAGDPAGGLVAMTRHLPKTGGGHNTTTAGGLFAGFANWASPGDLDVEVDLLFVNLDGGWTSDGGTTWVVP